MAKKRKGISTSARKAKGRRLQNKVRDLILEEFSELTLDDVRSTPMGVAGEDIQLSSEARKYVPYSIECKAREDFGNSIMWSALDQAEKNSNQHTPLVVFTKNRKKKYVIIELDKFISLIKK